MKLPSGPFTSFVLASADKQSKYTRVLRAELGVSFVCAANPMRGNWSQYVKVMVLTVFDKLIPSVSKSLNFTTVSSTAPAVDRTSNHDVSDPVCISSSSRRRQLLPVRI